MIRKEILIFIVCLFIAFAWWVVHQLHQTYIREYHLNSFIVQVPEVYEQDSIPLSLKVRVKGSGLKIVLLENYFPEKIYIPFKKLKKLNKKRLFAIPPEIIEGNESMPVNVKVLNIEPDTIRIEFKNKSKK